MLTLDRVIRGIKDPKAALNFILKKLCINYQLPNLGHIVLYVNSVCNARCLMCDVGQRNKRGIDAMVYGNRFMPLSMLRKILNDSIVRKKRFFFNILMTEPLLTPKIGDYIKEIKKYGHNVNLTTNGFLLPEKAQEIIDAGVDSVQVSLDGPEKINDWIRGKKGFFDKAVKGIRMLKGKVSVRVNCTVSNLNYQHLGEFTDIINKKVKIGLLKFQFLDFVSGKMSKEQEKYPFKQEVSSIDRLTDPEKIDIAVLERQIRNIKKKNYENIEKIMFIPDIHEKKDLQRYFDKKGEIIEGYSRCTWPFSQIAINTNGDAYFHMRCFNYKIGNINEQSLNQIFNKSRARYFRREFIRAKMCFPACTRCCGVMFK